MAEPEHRHRGGDVALIGIGCLFPGAEGPHQFWRNIRAKDVMIREPQPGWGASRYLQSTGTTRITTAAGGYLDSLYSFDPVELGIMPSSIDGSEPDQFLALKVAREALLDAGYLDNYDHVATGIVLGHSTYLHRGNANVVQHGVVVDQTVELIRQLLPGAPPAALEKLRAVLVAQLPPFNADIAPGLVPNVMTGRIANKLDLRGPNYLIDAACSSSLLAVKTAIEELRSGRSDLMLAGGVNAAIPAEVNMVFTQLGALSRQSQVRPFDAAADGTLLGEGLGIVVLKRLDDARAAGDRVYAVVKGVGQSSDGKGSGLLAPRLEGEVLAIRRAYEDAGVPAESIGLIEAHGTGIPLGDRTEIGALREFFGAREGDLPRVALGALKSMIGHCIPAAGIAGLIKTALALHHRVLPPTICGEVSGALGIDGTKCYVNTESRPWIAPRKTARRAGVNAFGFGGINSHAVLEEAAEPADGVRPAHLAAELAVLSAADPAALALAIEQLQSALAGALANAPLAAVCAALAARDHGGAVRLAIVTDSPADLADKLGKARERIAAGKAKFQIRSGIFCSDEAHGGKLAFVFPGEGAQYQNMFVDMLEAFPEARRWFDFWDGLYGDARGFRPSESVFPAPTCLPPPAKERLEQALFGLELGSESAFVASQALLAVTRRLGLRPDALVGHSSGEHAALYASGVLAGADWDDLENRIRELNRLYRAMEQASAVPGGALLTVGAVPRERTLALAETAGVHIALDNCRQQTVLYGQRSELDTIATQLAGEGGLCAFLPIDRPYHTPLFAPVAEMVEGLYGGLGFRAPQTPLYSCATAAPMPSDPDAIRRLAAGQWQSRVRFTETIERMYADGVRTFVEVGPSANLTGFIENILQGKDFLAVALDSRRRSSLLQMLHALGRLWAAGLALDVGKLFAGRPLAAADLAATAPPRKRARVFPNTLAMIALPAETQAELRAAFFPPLRVGEPALPVDLPQAPVAAAPSDSAEPAGPAPSDYPFLHRIVAQGPDLLTAECDIDTRYDAFLRHHVLYATQVSDLDPGLTALPVVPLAVSLEMLAEVASALAGGLVPVRLEQVRAFNWISVDAGARTIVLEAMRRPAVNGETRIFARLSDDAGMPLVEALVALAESRPAPPNLRPLPLAEPQPPIWTNDQLYRTGMFHGPLFQSIAGLAEWDRTGLDARLADTPLEGFFQPAERPRLLLNPVLLDAIGHVTAFWIAQHLGTDFSSFPSSIEAIELFDAGREDTAGSLISGRLAFEARGPQPWYLVGNFTCLAPDGVPLFRATGWRDRFFDVPHSFYLARWQPREEFYGHEVSNLFTALPAGALVWRVPAFPDGFLDDAGGIWRRVLAHTVLSGEEREQWLAFAGHRRGDDWLIGRLAMKEAARAWFMRNQGLGIYPADLTIRTEPEGKPYIAGEGLETLGPLPEISVSHVDGEAVAVAGPAGHPVGIDLEKLGRVRAQDLLAGGFSDHERALLPAAEDETSVLQAWCAKEAAAKCLGTGLNGQPRSFVLSALDDRQSWSRIIVPGDVALSVSLAVDDQSVLAVAYADQG